MSLSTRTRDRRNTDGFGPDPIVVLTAVGTHDVSRLVYLLSRGNCEHVELAQRLASNLRRKPGGYAALAVLKDHGGPDFTEGPFKSTPDAEQKPRLTERQVLDIRDDRRSARVVAEAFGISHTTVLKIRRREIWRSV